MHKGFCLASLHVVVQFVHDPEHEPEHPLHPLQAESHVPLHPEHPLHP